MMVPIRKILATLGPHEDVKRVVMNHYKNKGANLDEFPRTRFSVETMADSLTRAEDVLEPRRGIKWQELRQTIRDMRRELENYLDGAARDVVVSPAASAGGLEAS